jgi:hypothetical protein
MLAGRGISKMRISGIVALGAALMLAIFLAGCSFGTIKTGLADLQGQPVSSAIAKLGVPNEDRMIAGQHVYTWYSSTFDEGTQYQCKIRIMTTPPSETITGSDYEGNNGMCARYAAKLRG